MTHPLFAAVSATGIPLTAWIVFGDTESDKSWLSVGVAAGITLAGYLVATWKSKKEDEKKADKTEVDALRAQVKANETEITECQRDRGLLRKEMQVMKAMLIRMEDREMIAVIEADCNGIITSWNAAATGMFLYRKADMMGQRLKILVPKRFWPIHEMAFNKIATDSKPFLRQEPLETFAMTATGEEIPVTITLSGYEENGKLKMTAEIRHRPTSSSDSGVLKTKDTDFDMKAYHDH